MTGALWAAASGIGFGLFQSLHRLAVRDIDAYVSTFLQLAVAAVVLAAASLATQDLGLLGEASTWSLVAFALAGLAAIVPMIAGAYLVSSSGPAAGIRDARFGLGCALMWALSPLFTVEGLDGLPSPLLGVTLGMLAAVAAYGGLLAARGAGLGLRAIQRRALGVKLLAGVLVALATWWRWVALDDAAVGVVLALNLVSVPIVLFLAPILSGRHLEHVTSRVWAGAALVVLGSLALIGVA